MGDVGIVDGIVGELTVGEGDGGGEGGLEDGGAAGECFGGVYGAEADAYADLGGTGHGLVLEDGFACCLLVAG